MGDTSQNYHSTV